MFRFDADISDCMILQRDTEDPITGTAEPCSRVEICLFDGDKPAAAVCADSDRNGRFCAMLPSMKGGKTVYRLEGSCCGEKITVCDVLFGDVFHITGQSNMELPVYRIYDPLDPSKPFSGAQRTPNEPYIREFRVPISCCFDPVTECDHWTEGSWIRADSEKAAFMSAVGYFFAEALYREFGIPVGLVNTSAGGSPIEARFSYQELRELGGYDSFLDRVTSPNWMELTEREDKIRTDEHNAMLDRLDKIGQRILSGDFPAAERTDMPYRISGFSGRVWLRKQLQLPDGTDISDVMLMLGTLTDADRTYVNGIKVGETGYMYPPRYYSVPSSVLKNGQITIAVCLDIFGSQGGFTEGKPICLKCGNTVIDLSKDWYAAKAVSTDRLVPAEFFQGLPLSLYGITTAPAYHRNYKALIVYQGESNGTNADRYRELFTHFIERYRERCGSMIPVIWAQLPEFGAISDDSWAVLRQAQLECTELPETAMAVTLGLGENNDLHPINKWEVGRRLALCAKTLLYKKSDSKPVRCTAARFIGGKAVLTFSRDIELHRSEGFEAVYPDRLCHADAVQTAPRRIELTLERGCPLKVRYNRCSAPKADIVLDNDGLPVSPFEINVTQ